MEVLFSSFRVANRMILHIKTCRMDEAEAKADYVRHNREILAHVDPDKVCGGRLCANLTKRRFSASWRAVWCNKWRALAIKLDNIPNSLSLYRAYVWTINETVFFEKKNLLGTLVGFRIV